MAATRALHELCVLHLGNVTELLSKAPVLDKENKEFQDKIQDKSNENGISRNSTQASGAGTVKNIKPEAASGTVLKAKKPVARLADAGTKGMISTPEEKKPFLARKRALTIPTEKGKEHTLADENHFPGSFDERNASVPGSGYEFGDMPVNEKLRMTGHGKIDLGILWIMKQKDGLYFQSRYGVLRISPIESGMIRITFAREGKVLDKVHPGIDIQRAETKWMYKESASEVVIMTDELCLQVDKKGGAIRFLTRDKKLLFEERNKECRQFEKFAQGMAQARLFLNFQKGEKLYALNGQKEKVLDLRGSARYISSGGSEMKLPLVLSDKGYGIVPAAEGPVIFCDIPAYGTWLLMENAEQIDYYFIEGKQKDDILGAYLRLCENP